MFRDEQYVVVEPAIGLWQPPRNETAPVRTPVADLFANDEIGAVWHVYREIARRIPHNAYTRHASTLGDALR
jgi:hypothetical protein